MSEARNTGIDIMRIFAGFGVVLLHVTDTFMVYPPYAGVGGTQWWIITLINTVFRTSVPLFVMISGFLLLGRTEKIDSKKFYSRRFARIGIPTVFWVIIYLLLLVQMGEVKSISSLFERLLTLNIFHLYFLFLILELYFITPLFHSFLRQSGTTSRNIMILSSFLLTTSVMGLNYLFPTSAVFMGKNITTVFIPFIFYYLLGPTLKKIKISFSSILSLIILFGYLTIIIGIISKGDTDSYLRQFESIPVMLLSILMFVILYQTNYLSFLQAPKIKSFLSYISSLMFGMYLVHVLILMGIDRWYPIIPGHVGSPMWVYVLLKVGIVFLLSLAVSAFLRRLPLSRFFIT